MRPEVFEKLTKMAIVSVLEDIKAEMEELKVIDWHNKKHQVYNSAITDALDIIDKHISGKEN